MHIILATEIHNMTDGELMEAADLVAGSPASAPPEVVSALLVALRERLGAAPEMLPPEEAADDE